MKHYATWTGAAALTAVLLAAGCVDGNRRKDAPKPGDLDDASYRQSVASAVFNRQAFSIAGVSFRSGSDTGYTDCYRLQKSPDDGHLYEECLYTDSEANTVKDGEVRDLGLRISHLTTLQR